MAVKVVSKELNDRGGVVIVEGDTQEELTSAAARQAAITAATGSIHKPGTSGGESPYPVDANGETSDELMMGRGEVAAYRCDFKITGGL